MAAIYQVRNAGFSDHNSRQLLAKLDREVLARKPQLVVMMVGTNDALNSGNSVPIEEYRENLGAIAEKLKAAGVKLMLMTTPPCHDPYVIARHKPGFFTHESPTRKVTQTVRVIHGVAAKYGLPVVAINTILNRVGNVGESAASMLRSEANCGAKDGVHPTPEGYRLIAVAVYQAILDHQLPRQQILCYGDSITFGANVKGAGTAEGETYPARLAALLKQ